MVPRTLVSAWDLMPIIYNKPFYVFTHLRRNEISSLREKCPYSEFFWSVFSRSRTKYGEILRISPYSVRMLENTYQKNSKHRHFLRSVIHIQKHLNVFQNQKAAAGKYDVISAVVWFFLQTSPCLLLNHFFLLQNNGKK